MRVNWSSARLQQALATSNVVRAAGAGQARHVLGGMNIAKAEHTNWGLVPRGAERPRVLACVRTSPRLENAIQFGRQLRRVSASSVHAEFGSSVHAGPDRLCTRAFFAPDRLYTQCLLLCTKRDRGVDSRMFPCLSVV